MQSVKSIYAQTYLYYGCLLYLYIIIYVIMYILYILFIYILYIIYIYIIYIIFENYFQFMHVSYMSLHSNHPQIWQFNTHLTFTIFLVQKSRYSLTGFSGSRSLPRLKSRCQAGLWYSLAQKSGAAFRFTHMVGVRFSSQQNLGPYFFATWDSPWGSSEPGSWTS